MTLSSCPACEAASFAPNESQSPQFSETVGWREFIQPAYRVRCCSHCGLYYKTDFLDPRDLAEYYKVVDFNKWERPGYFPTERPVLRFLRSLPPGSALLDYGCSTGRLLSSLVGRYDCYGFEINEEAARRATSKGLQMCTSEQLRQSMMFDAVILADVFEHLPQPLTTLGDLVRGLKPKGHLLIITGNADSRFCQRNPAMFWYFRNVEHLCMLSRKHAYFLEQKFGLRLKLWEETCHYDTRLRERLRQHARDFAFWAQRPQSPLWSRTLLSFLPVIRRARNWPGPPGLSCTRDHVVAAFQRN